MHSCTAPRPYPLAAQHSVQKSNPPPIPTFPKNVKPIPYSFSPHTVVNPASLDTPHTKNHEYNTPDL